MGPDQQHTPARRPAPLLRIHARPLCGTTVVELHGTLDIATVPDARHRLDALTATPGAQVIVDLRLIGFLDCTALGLLCRTRRRLLERHGRLAVICSHSRHLNIFRATGLHTHLRPAPTLPEALAQLHQR